MNVEKLRNLYENANKKSQIGDKIGISRTALFDIMNENVSPKVENLEKIAKYFNVPVGYFFDEETESGNTIGGLENMFPIIPVEAMAGYGKGDSQVMEYEIEDMYHIPEFQNRGVAFLIRASGSSMYPKYSNGDLLACRPINDTSFFQWGKVYVLDTEQGAIVKRLFECKEDENSLECHSDNKESYPPFKIKKKSIRKVSIVVGVVRIES